MTHRIPRRRWLAGSALAALTGPSCRDRDVPEDRNVATFWYSYGGHNRQILEGMVDDFNRSQGEHFIIPVFQGDYYESLAKLRVAIAAHVPPTISHVIGEVIPYLTQAGVLQELDPFKGDQDLDLVPALAQAGTWTDGEKQPLVALPFNRSTPIAYVNLDLFEREGLAAPRTWTEMRQVAAKLTRGDERFGLELPITWWFWVALQGQAGGSLVDPGGTPSLGGRAGEAAIEFLQAMVHEDRSMKLPTGRDSNAWEVTNQDFLSERVGMIWTSTAFLKYLEANASFRVLATPLPAGKRRSVPTGGTFFVMLKQAPKDEQRAGWEFLRWMMLPQQTRYWSEQTGYLPVCNAAVRELDREGYYEEHPNARVAYDQLEFAEPWPWSEDLFRIQREILQPRLESAVILGTDAQQLMAEARRLAEARR